MIHADVRARLTARDFDLALLLLARGSTSQRDALERRMHIDGPDAVLDAPELAERLCALKSILVPSEALFYYVLVRRVLLESGIDDRALTDYLAALLAEFGQRDRAWRVDWHDDATHRYVVDILADQAQSDGARRFRVTVHLGNWALWVAGIFPGYVTARQQRRGGPDMRYYDQMGRRGFAEASGHTLASAEGLSDVFAAAAEHFPVVRGALNRLSSEVFFARRAA